MYYHSTDWGFDDNYQQKKRLSRNRLSALKLPMLNSISCNFHELSSGKVSLGQNRVYLVTVDDPSKACPRRGYFGISTITELESCIIQDFGENSLSLNTCQCHLIEQLFPCDGCFTGAIFSNGTGDLVCEVIADTIDNRELTSGSTREYKRNRIIYCEGVLSFCDNIRIWATILPEISICITHKGYYEFAYGLVRGTKGVYFSYFSEDSAYQNIFPFQISLETEYIRCRCIENFYLRHIGVK